MMDTLLFLIERYFNLPCVSSACRILPARLHSVDLAIGLDVSTLKSSSSDFICSQDPCRSPPGSSAINSATRIPF
jgi:hypothetical protein